MLDSHKNNLIFVRFPDKALNFTPLRFRNKTADIPWFFGAFVFRRSVMFL